MVRYGTVRHGTLRCGRYGTVRRTTRYDAVRYGAVRCDALTVEGDAMWWECFHFHLRLDLRIHLHPHLCALGPQSGGSRCGSSLRWVCGSVCSCAASGFPASSVASPSGHGGAGVIYGTGKTKLTAVGQQVAHYVPVGSIATILP